MNNAESESYSHQCCPLDAPLIVGVIISKPDIIRTEMLANSISLQAMGETRQMQIKRGSW